MTRILLTNPPNTVVGAVPQASYPDGALDHRDMAQKLRDILQNRACVSATAGAAGAGNPYQVGEILELVDSGATETFPGSFARPPRATVEVTAIDGGNRISAVRIRNSGAYETDPTAASGSEYDLVSLNGSGTGGRVIGTFAAAEWTVLRETSEVASAAVAAPGTGYVDSETVTLTTPTGEVVAASATIAVTGGAIDSFTIDTPGVYHVLPATLTVTGGSGSGATATPVYAELPDGTSQNLEMIFQSTLVDGPIFGIRTHDGGNGGFELAHLKTYTASLDYASQVGISPGRYDGAGDDQHGSYTPLTTKVSPDFFNFHIISTDRYVGGKFNIDTGIYSDMFLGFHSQAAPPSEPEGYPYPAVVGGCASLSSTGPTTPANDWGGMTSPVALQSTVRGPWQINSPGGNWVTFRNGSNSGSGNAINQDFDFGKVIPNGVFNPTDASIPVASRFFGLSLDWDVYATVATSGPSRVKMPAPGASDNKQVGYDVFLMTVDQDLGIYGELPDVKWTDRTTGIGTVATVEDEFPDDDGNLWIIYNTGRLTDRQYWHLLKASP